MTPISKATRRSVSRSTANAAYSVGTPGTATVTIADNDVPTVTVAASDAAASEAGSDPGTFTVTRTGATTTSLNVQYSVGGTATSGSDYTPLTRQRHDWSRAGLSDSDGDSRSTIPISRATRR